MCAILQNPFYSTLFAKTDKEPLFAINHSNMKAKVAATAEREKRGGKLEKKDLNSGVVLSQMWQKKRITYSRDQIGFGIIKF